MRQTLSKLPSSQPVMKRSCEKYLEEVLAGADEGKLSTGAVRLGLAASNSLNQLWDLLCHSLGARTLC